MKEKTKKRIRGSITVLMVIIMLPMMTLSAVIVDSSRINMARSMISSAGDLTMNTALANYDTILKDVYGLFAMSQNMTDDELAASLKEYFEKTLVSYGVTSEAEAGDYVDALIGDFKDIIANTDSGSVSNFLKMNVVDFSAKKVDNSSLANPDILRSQIVEYMKYRAPLNFGLSFLDSVKAFKNVQAQTIVVQKQVEAQESVQDVTSACKDLISTIRAYDVLITAIQSGDKAVKGKSSKSDGQIVEIKDYHTQVDKYRTAWADNYSHVNKLVLVYLLKSPSTASLYLKNLNYTSSEWFIKTDNSGVLYGNTGISVNPTLASTTSEAQSQLQSQIDTLNNSSNIEKKTANAYVGKDFLPYNYISSDCSSFANEANAITAFIEFEKLLNNEGDIKYSDVKTTLESIYALGKIYDNYYSKISADISAAETAKNEANNKVNNANTNATNHYNDANGNVANINNANKDYTVTYDFLNGIKNADNENLKDVFAATLAIKNVVFPSATKSTGGKTFTDFGNFFATNYKEKSDDSDNRFLKLYKEIIESKIKNDGAYSSICSAAKSYLEDVQNGDTTKSFEDYVKSKAGNSSENNALFKALSHLYKLSGYADKVLNAINSYNGVYNNYAALVSDAQAKTNDYNNKVTQRDTMKSKYSNCLSGFNTFAKNYQTDVYYYDRYITTASNVVSSEVSAINSQFTAIKNNVDSIIKKLEEIEQKLSATSKAIETYNKNIDTWKSANDSYVTNNSDDSFSKQNSADIDASKSQYDEISLKALTDYVGSIKSEYQDFYNRIADTTHFKYGNKKIDTISSADDAKAAVPAGVSDALATIVTVDAANGKLADLYNGEATGSIEMDNWYFLNPVLPIQFLKYLNETYKDPATSSSSDNVSVTVNGETINDFNYESAKNDMKNNSGGEIKDETDANKYGYSYDGKTVSKDGLPSKNKDTKSSSNSKFNFEERDGGGVNVSGGFEEQNKSLGSILSGINDIANNTLENTYILSYIFNNFSYNTLIQDMVINGNNVNAPNAWTALSESNQLLASGSGSLNQYLNAPKTLSNYAKNRGNNYLYGAEIEYILYGNENASTNVKYTKASIYAIRFAFNCIYAFTNSEIRNTTMAVGLSVQAATLGVVPYQIVQIVLQLALAAAESAVDLQMMNNGLKVSVIKTSDTWSLSLSSGVSAAGDIVADKASEYAQKAINMVSSGLQGIVDASVDELNSSITDLQANLELATRGKINEVADAMFGHIQSAIEDKLNELQYINYAKKNAHEEVERVFNELQNTLENDLKNKFPENPVVDAVLPLITSRINTILSSMKAKVTEVITNAPAGDVGSAIVSKMSDIKLELISVINDNISVAMQRIPNLVQSLTGEISGELNGYIEQTANDLSEGVAKEIKEKITDATNDFVEKYLDSGSDTIGGVDGIDGKTSSSVASIIKFGYKDYLMLFTFISISVNDDAVLARTADVIQLNIQNATISNGASYQHKLTGDEGKAFKMTDAKTYIAIQSTVKLDMLFLNLDFFANAFDDGSTNVTGQLTPAATINYKGLYGY